MGHGRTLEIASRLTILVRDLRDLELLPTAPTPQGLYRTLSRFRGISAEITQLELEYKVMESVEKSRAQAIKVQNAKAYREALESNAKVRMKPSLEERKAAAQAAADREAPISEEHWTADALPSMFRSAVREVEAFRRDLQSYLYVLRVDVNLASGSTGY